MQFEEMINTIQLGDCYELIKNIPDHSIDLVYIDIPYLMARGGYGSSEISARLKNRNDSIEDIRNGIDYSIFDELCRVMKNIYIYIWCSKNQILDIMKYFIDDKKCIYELLVWCKTNPSPTGNNMYLPDVEYCLMFREPSKTKLNDGYELKSRWHISQSNKKDKDKYNHPTIKPLELVKRHILHSTQPNDIVLDCFCGSGTTCVACKETGRRYIGIEIDKKYFDIAKERIERNSEDSQLNLFECMGGDE